MAALMLAARWVVQQRLCFPYSLLFVWDTGEEGLGNLNGVRGLMEDYADRIAALVALDGVYPGLIDGAVGSVRCMPSLCRMQRAPALRLMWAALPAALR